MNTRTQQSRQEKAQYLPVIQVADAQYYVQSEEGKIAYFVSISPTVSCTCADFAKNGRNDPEFACKHILAVLNTDTADVKQASFLDKRKPKLDERFIIKLKDKEFVLYSGLLDLGHQHGLTKLQVESVQFPTKENGMEAICKATAETKNQQVFVDFGDASPQNTNRVISQHLIRMASTRAKARVLRDMNNIGMTALEELADLDDITTNSKQSQTSKPASDGKRGKVSKLQQPDKQGTENQTPHTPPVAPQAAPAATSSKIDTNTRAMISEAQKRAIANLSRRRGMTEEELDSYAYEQYGVILNELCSSSAAALIRQLQQSA